MAGLEPVQIQGFAVWTQDSETGFVWHVPYCARVVMPRPQRTGFTGDTVA